MYVVPFILVVGIARGQVDAGPDRAEQIRLVRRQQLPALQRSPGQPEVTRSAALCHTQRSPGYGLG